MKATGEMRPREDVQAGGGELQKPDGHRIRVWFDDGVAATEYIGPLAAGQRR